MVFSILLFHILGSNFMFIQIVKLNLPENLLCKKQMLG